jgi:hypothetical protein
MRSQPGKRVLPGSAAGSRLAAGRTNSLNSEVEPWMDANPTDPDNLIAVWQQDRWSNGGARGGHA